jgi:hypothetical protein
MLTWNSKVSVRMLGFISCIQESNKTFSWYIVLNGKDPLRWRHDQTTSPTTVAVEPRFGGGYRYWVPAYIFWQRHYAKGAVPTGTMAPPAEELGNIKRPLQKEGDRCMLFVALK